MTSIFDVFHMSQSKKFPTVNYVTNKLMIDKSEIENVLSVQREKVI